MTTSPHPPMLTIVGSGLASYVLAKAFRALDPETPLRIITADDGHFYNKPQLSTALTTRKTPDMLVTSTAEEIAELLNAQIITHTPVERIDRESKTLICGETHYPYDRCVLAIGSFVLTPNFRGDAQDRIFSVNSLVDYRCWRDQLEQAKHIAVVGGGLVGTEFAQDLVNAGVKVDLVHDFLTPVNRILPEPCGTALMDALTERGVHWHMNTMVTAVHNQDAGVRLTLANDETIDADLVLSSVGIACSTGLAEDAGLDVEGGIVVNRQMQTSDLHIFALGDCAQIEGMIKHYIAPLRKQAETLAKILTGEQAELCYPAMPVNLKTPCLPTSICPVPEGVEGSWDIQGESPDLEAYFTDTNGTLRGFALMGKAVRLRQVLLKDIPNLLG